VRVTTWNVNSIRSRLQRVLDWIDHRQPDVLGLQETKVTDEDFPRGPFEELGYRVETWGQKTYNGVALVTREPLDRLARGLGGDGTEAEERRLIAGRVEDLRVVCVYVPNGRSPESPKFRYKLEWMEGLRTFLARWTSPADAVVVMGDFNVAPEDRDVHDPDAWRGKVLFHPDEHAVLERLKTWGLVDLQRLHDARPGLYTWWDYRTLAFPRDAGMRIDLLLGTPAAAARCRGVRIDRDARKGEKPSDHAPVTAFFDEPAIF